MTIMKKNKKRVRLPKYVEELRSLLREPRPSIFERVHLVDHLAQDSQVEVQEGVEKYPLVSVKR